jgi:regulator of protease activity HflC (stomatin/prohibitin superfamily)
MQTHQTQNIPEFQPKKVFPLVSIGALLLILFISWNSITVTIEAGFRGVLFKKFGGGIDLEHVYSEGFHFIAPWNTMVEYEVRQQEIAEKMDVLSNNGLQIDLDVSAWYQPEKENVAKLHSTIGVDYLHRVIIPALRSSTRSVIGRYTPEQIYSTKKDAIQEEIFVETKKILTGKFVQLNKILLRSIKLPESIKRAIESKSKQEQLALEYKYKLDRALQEAERQRIEAEGKAKANNIINASLTDKILREKGISATLELANSSNSKIVIIGNSKDGLPIILGDSK